MRPDPEAVEAVLTWKAPKNDTQLMSFLGFANYYQDKEPQETKVPTAVNRIIGIQRSSAN